MTTQTIKVFFNFRSPYCYLASKSMFRVFDDFHVDLEWYPLSGWDGRSPPEIAKSKLPIARQDMKRWARRLGIPVTPPPVTTDPTKAGMASLLAEQKGLLREYVVEMMRAEWACGYDIGEDEVLLKVGESIGLDRDELAAAMVDPVNQAKLDENWCYAESLGVIGVPTFVVGDEIFWGNDRIDFLVDHLTELRLRKL